MAIEKKYVYSYAEAYAAGAKEVGGKGWNLARLSRYGFRVPDGLVLGISAYQDFIRFSGLSESIESLSRALERENVEEYQSPLLQLQENIMNASLPPAVLAELEGQLITLDLVDKALAVRSSASLEDSDTMSFAGVYASLLNVCNKEQRIRAIKSCYASLWSPTAVAYRRRFKLENDQVLPAVLIMDMVNARASGVGFSGDPESGRLDRLMIQANWGSGESVVSGLIEPDTYSLDTSAWKALPQLLSVTVGTKAYQTMTRMGGGTILVEAKQSASAQVLSHEEIENLGLIILRVFESLGEGEQHLDIEWAWDGEQFVLLQARPITVLPRYTLPGFEDQADIWSNGNFRDAMPMVVSPLHRRVMKNMIDNIQYHSLHSSGYPIPEGFQFSRYINGRLYCNISALQWAYHDNTGMAPEIFNVFWGGHHPAIEIKTNDFNQGETERVRQEKARESLALIAETAAQADKIFADMKAVVSTYAKIDYPTLSETELIERYQEIGKTLKDYSELFDLLSGAGNLPLAGFIQKLLMFFGERTMEIVNGLMAGGEAHITSADQGYRLQELAKTARVDPDAKSFLTSTHFAPLLWEQQLSEHSVFKHAFAHFLEEFGHRGIDELDICNPRWREDPAYLLDTVKSLMLQSDDTLSQNRQRQAFQRAWQEVINQVPERDWGRIKQEIKESQEGAALREMTKSVLVMIVGAYRQLALGIGQRLHQSGLLKTPHEVFYCSWPDLVAIMSGEWDGAGLAALVLDHQANQTRKEALPAPDYVREENPVFTPAQVNVEGNYLQGVAASSGRATGMVRLIHHPREGNRLQPGDILAAPSTDPGWIPLFLNASALIIETGGSLSHGVIVAREYGLPTVINVPGIMRQLKEAQMVTVDGNTGRIYLHPER